AAADEPAVPRETIKLPHPTFVTGVAFSPDSKLFATAAGLKITFFNAATGAAVREFDAPGRAPEQAALVAFSPDGSRIATNTGAAILIWDPESAKLVQQIPAAIPGSRSPVCFSPDGKTIFTSALTKLAKGAIPFRYMLGDLTSAQHQIQRWDVETGKP